MVRKEIAVQHITPHHQGSHREIVAFVDEVVPVELEATDAKGRRKDRQRGAALTPGARALRGRVCDGRACEHVGNDPGPFFAGV